MLLVALLASAADPVLVLEGAVPSEGDFLTLAFDVPPGTAEVEVAHDDLSDVDILDWGLRDPVGALRGWGGGNTDAAVVGAEAASRSYLPGPITAGPWEVLVGKAKVVGADPRYRVEVTLRGAPTLAPQDERRAYVPVDLGGGARWVSGDFHVHSRESGDATATLDEVAALAESRGLDFVELAEHNTTSTLTWLGDAQDRHPDLLLVPGAEITTYAGHANGIGLTAPAPFTMGFEGVDFLLTAQSVADAGALLSINHPVLDLGDACIGCAWDNPVPPPGQLAAVEIATGGWSETGMLFTEDAIDFWDALCAEGLHLAAIGGSDDHRAGTGTGPFDSPIGDPTTVVWVETLSVEGLLAGIRDGRTVVKLQGPEDPMVVLTADPAPEGDTILGNTATVRATVTGGVGTELRLVTDGDVGVEVPVDADPYVFETTLANPTSRVRAEVWGDGHPRTVSSHLWVEWAIDPPLDPGACGCGSRGGSKVGLALVALASLLACRRRPEVACP